MTTSAVLPPGATRSISGEVLDALAQALPGVAIDSAQRRQFERLVGRIRASFSTDDERNLLCAQVPILIAEGLGAPTAEAQQAAMVCSLVYGAARLVDDAMDGETIEAPSGWRTEHGLFALITALGAATFRLITASSQPPDRQLTLVTNLSRLLLRMAAGQLADVNHFGHVPAVSQVLDSVAAKSGAMVAGFACWGAVVSGADEETQTQCAAFGAELGIARQLASDLCELRGGGRDAVNRAATLPIVLHAREMDEPARRLFFDRYGASVASPGRRDALMGELHRSGAWSAVGLHIEMALDRAARALDQIGLRSDERGRLGALLDFTRHAL